MKTFILTALGAAFLTAAPIEVSAQVVGSATAEARARVACGGAKLVSATYLGNGMLRVTCQQESQSQESTSATEAAIANTALAGTGLGTVTAFQIIIAVGALAALTGSNNEGTTTTVTTQSTSSTESADR